MTVCLSESYLIHPDITLRLAPKHLPPTCLVHLLTPPHDSLFWIYRKTAFETHFTFMITYFRVKQNEKKEKWLDQVDGKHDWRKYIFQIKCPIIQKTLLEIYNCNYILNYLLSVILCIFWKRYVFCMYIIWYFKNISEIFYFRGGANHYTWQKQTFFFFFFLE